MQKISGLFFFLTGTIILLGIVIAEIFYPDYNTSTQMICALGSTLPPGNKLEEPSAFIFDKSMILSGFTLLVGSYMYLRLTKDNLLSITFLCMGVGVIGVGIFPTFTGNTHNTFTAILL